MKKIVFPTPNNKAFRNGFLCLQAFEPDFNIANMFDLSKNGDTQGNSWINKVKYLNNKEYQPIFDAKSSEEYLKNALQNRDLEQQSSKIGELGFVAYLPTPLSVSDATSVEWTPLHSSIIDGKYSRIKNAKVGADMIDNLVGFLNTSTNGGFDEKVKDWTGFERNQIVGALRNGELQDLVDKYNMRGIAVFKSIMNHEIGKISASSKDAFAGFNADMNLIDALNEQNARDGRRQVLFDPGYWQQFQGVKPRGLSFKWELIPENHSEAVDLLALVNRFKEFSLPQAVSATELISPAIWRIRFHNDFLQSQLLYSDLVLTNVNMTYMENGELHVTGTPKKVSLELTFQEVKAPINNIYRDGQRAAGSANGSNSGKPDFSKKLNDGFNSTKVLDSLNLIQEGKINEKVNELKTKLGGFDKLFSKIPNATSGLEKILGAGSAVIAKVQATLGSVVSGIQNAVNNVATGLVTGATGALGDFVSGPIGSVFGDKYGKLTSDLFNNIGTAASNALTETIKTGNIKALPNALKTSVLGAATNAASDAVNQITGDALDFAGGLVKEATAPLVDWAKDTAADVGETLSGWGDSALETVGLQTPEETARSQAARDAKREMSKVQEEAEKAKNAAEEAEKAKKLADALKQNPNQDKTQIQKAEAQAKQKMEEAKEATKRAEEAKQKASNAIEQAKEADAKVQAQKQVKTDWEKKEANFKKSCVDAGGRWTAGTFDQTKGANSTFGSCRV